VASYVDGVRQIGTGITALLSSSRPFLEHHIRRRTLSLPNVRAITGRAIGLDFGRGIDRVSGVRYTDEASTEHTRSADLVVDAMGRSSKLGEWLAHSGRERPALRRMTIQVNYATARFARIAGQSPITCAVARNNIGGTTGAALAAIEDDQWLVMLSGYGDQRPGRSPAEFVRHCRERLPAVFGQVTSDQLLGDVHTYHQADSRRRDYDPAQLPAGLISLGDAVASFNPVYGQGISSAALHACCLANYLESHPDLDAPALGFFNLQRVIVDAAWDISTSADAARQPPVQPLTRKERLRRWLGRQVISASRTDPVIARRFGEVAAMLAHPHTLATPGTVLRAVAANQVNRHRRTSTHR
jgi:2-polyprenyl-6-methoxyphenol hydroxylase-like FAD-dependent oxidoreductase